MPHQRYILFFSSVRGGQACSEEMFWWRGGNTMVTILCEILRLLGSLASGLREGIEWFCAEEAKGYPFPNLFTKQFKKHKSLGWILNSN